MALRLDSVPESFIPIQCRSPTLIEPEQIGQIVHVVDDDVDVTVVVKVGKGGAASSLGSSDRRSKFVGDIGEASVTQVLIHEAFTLLITSLRLELRDFGVDVTVDQKQIQPAVGIEIDEADSPAKPSRIEADAAPERPVLTQGRRPCCDRASRYLPRNSS